jgi:hypothetical protein
MLVRRNRSLLKPLLQDMDETKLVDTLHHLLYHRIFESELRAKEEFPDLFKPSRKNGQVQALEVEAARMLNEIASRDKRLKQRRERARKIFESSAPTLALLTPSATRVAPTNVAPINVAPINVATQSRPPPCPSDLPYEAQHLIITTTQKILEECCFDFATASMPQILQEKAWDCPAAGELNNWTKIFRNRGDLPIPEQLRYENLLGTIDRIRHTAVHRLNVTARQISYMLETAARFTQLLQDDLRAAQLEELLSDVNSKILAREVNENVIEGTASRRLQELQ